MTNLQMHLTKILKNEQAKSLYLEVAKGAIFKEQNIRMSHCRLKMVDGVEF